MLIGDWGIGDWGLVIGDWGLGNQSVDANQDTGKRSPTLNRGSFQP
jgi:hypothetical protein